MAYCKSLSCDALQTCESIMSKVSFDCAPAHPKPPEKTIN